MKNSLSLIYKVHNKKKANEINCSNDADNLISKTLASIFVQIKQSLNTLQRIYVFAFIDIKKEFDQFTEDNSALQKSLFAKINKFLKPYANNIKKIHFGFILKSIFSFLVLPISLDPNIPSYHNKENLRLPQA